MNKKLIASRDKCIKEYSKKTFDAASEFCATLLKNSDRVITEFLDATGEVDINNICFVAVGSVGRDEALPESDLDLLPVCADEEVLECYERHDESIRESLHKALQIKVSRGSDLTRAISLESFSDPETIGGDKDNRSTLTQRLLVLTESRRAGGKLSLGNIRSKLLNAYANRERTSGSHVLSLCNDIGRYYRTLCIEYKAKVDVHEKDWCTRNMKLRHSRKFWYFSLIMSIVMLANTHLDGQDDYKKGLLDAFELPPALRLVNSISDKHSQLTGKILDRFAWFLEFMSDGARREALSKIDHGDRYKIDWNNPFPMLKLNSNALHSLISNLIQEQEAHVRQRIVDWFLL